MLCETNLSRFWTALCVYEAEKCWLLCTFLMSNSTFLSKILMFSNRSMSRESLNRHKSLCIVVRLSSGRRRIRGLTPHAKKNSHSGNKSWWQKFFFQDGGNWLGKEDEDMAEGEAFYSSSEDELSEGEKFEEWKRRAEAIMELREAQEDMRNEENRSWEDWVVDETNDAGSSSSSWDGGDWNDRHEKWREDVRADPSQMIPRRGLVEYVRDFVEGSEDEDMLYEDRVFRYASINSVSSFALCFKLAKFLAVLVIIPLTLDFLVHDFVLMPFLESVGQGCGFHASISSSDIISMFVPTSGSRDPLGYVKTVPLAAEMLDLTRHQKLELVKEIKLEKARYRLEVEIGKSPPLSDEELWLELRHKALELRDERRLANRSAFANILSDMVFGISFFILLYTNKSKVALLKFTGYKIINNTTDAGKAIILICLADMWLGSHSEVGWHALTEIALEHYGLEVDEAAITIYVCTVPVFLDCCAKLWLFNNLPRLSPKVERIIQDMKWN
ncbi:hypothetical protein RHMOL_Rhmol01G0097800 [Rhododendron molle]|uniref:Uncharacterized protein n=1 Tax=Rhododendron molle TaxID=49168 RepID=A0ACC0Q1A8_RHOML|nr:hypothetical protein RHMOL_Rhmol01G0097800 [Rhododendron molle]